MVSTEAAETWTILGLIAYCINVIVIHTTFVACVHAAFHVSSFIENFMSLTIHSTVCSLLCMLLYWSLALFSLLCCFVTLKMF